MKILFLAPDPPVPPSGGGVRSFFILKGLLAKGCVDLIILRDIDIKQRETLKGIGVSEILVATKSKKNNLNKGNFQLFLKYVFPFLFSKEGLSEELASFAKHRYSYFPKFLRTHIFSWLKFWAQIQEVLPIATTYRLDSYKKLESLIKEKLLYTEYDIIFLDYSYIFPLIESELPNSVKVITNAHNVEYKILEQYATNEDKSLSKKHFTFERNLMRKYELKGFLHSDKILCCSKTDKELLIKNGISKKKIVEIPNGVDTDYFKPEPELTKVPSILFTGSFGYEPNVDAMHWFVNMILPQLRQKIPDIRLIIAGRSAKVLNKKLGTFENVDIINSPEDMRPLFNKAWVYVVPLRMGSGTRLKILEAWSMEKAVVATQKGIEGIDFKNFENVLIANTAEEMVSNVSKLIENKKLRNEIALQGRIKVEQKYNWNIVLDKLILD